MNNIKVKICGLMKSPDMELCMGLGVDILGFVVEYPLPVPWNLDRTRARLLLGKVRKPHQSCLVTGGSPDKIISLAAELRPSLVQLHYRETLEDTAIITGGLKKMGIGVIKTVPASVEDRFDQFGTADIKTIVEKLNKTDLLALLADSRSPSSAAKTGTILDYSFYRQVSRLSSKPVIAAGGITPANAVSFLTGTGAEFIDIMTGIETSPGEKDAGLLSELFSSIRSLDTSRDRIRTTGED
ncbi:MAG: phosphoribosylanthranilate isomerase [Bacillota bacterium]|nr:phosphoribosylanthranilate isomerase [Bacillota bacterium]